MKCICIFSSWFLASTVYFAYSYLPQTLKNLFDNVYLKWSMLLFHILITEMFNFILNMKFERKFTVFKLET